MHELANEIAGSAPLRGITPLATVYGLSCLREMVPEDITSERSSELIVAIALSELVGMSELFQMAPLSCNQSWHQALTKAMNARETDSRHSDIDLGISLMRATLPNISLRSYEDTLEARVQLRDELLAFRHWLSEQTRHTKSDFSSTETARLVRGVTESVRDLEICRQPIFKRSNV